MPRKDALEAAIRELLSLLDSGETLEAAYQKWFERHPLAWEALGYIGATPQPRLVDNGKRLLVPDFLAERPNGLADIVDLKAPTLAVLVKAGEPRVRASAAAYDAVVQLKDYSEFFASKAQRDKVAASTDYRVPASPRLLLIGGTATGNAKDLHTVEQQFGSSLTVISYDDVLHVLQLRHSQETERPGELAYYGFFSMLMVKDIRPGLPDSFLFDTGLGEHDRLSIRLDGLRRLSFVATSTDGDQVVVRSRSPLELGYWYRVWCELSLTSVATIATIRIDGTTQGRTEEWKDFPLSEQILDIRMTMGADLRGQNGAAMGLYFHGIATQPVELIARSRLENWATQRIDDGELVGTWVDFEEHQFLERGSLN